MDAYLDLNRHERAVLRTLAQGHIVGIRSIAERIHGRRLCTGPDTRHLSDNLAAICSLADKKLVVTRPVEGGRLLLAITRRGRDAVAPRNSWFSLSRLAIALSAGYALMGMTGCVTRPSLPSHQPLAGMTYPTVTGMGQVRDPQTGQLIFVPCNPCGAPTLKTPVAIVEPEPIRTPSPEPVLMRGNLVATLVEPAAVPPSKQGSVATPHALAAAVPTEQSSHVLFGRSSAKLDSEAIASIKRFAAQAGTVSSIRVTGQTDNTGTVAGNQRLARARANAVRAVLVAEGIAVNRIKTETCLTCFAEDNKTEDGQRLNRRAEIVSVMK